MSFSTASAKIAAGFAGMGFVITTRKTQLIELDDKMNLRFEVSETSALRPGLGRDDIYRAWMEGNLKAVDNSHPFLCAMHGCQNMDALMEFQRTGESHKLVLEPGTPLYVYKRGVEDPRLKLAPAAHGLVDLPLAAAAGIVGLPVIGIAGVAPRRKYLLPDLTHHHLEALLPYPHTVTELLQREVPGKHPLMLGVTHPQHVLVAAYNGTYAYARLLAEIKVCKRQVLVKDPYSQRRALIPENPSPTLEDEVREHFRIPR